MRKDEINSKRDNCTACRFQRDGVKTRRAIPHTCGKEPVSGYKKEIKS